jgi:signal peptidase II
MHRVQKQRRRTAVVKFFWLVPIALLLDQVSKWAVVSQMYLGQSIEVLGDFFRLTYIHNPGAAFGLNIGSPLLHTLASLVALGALAWMFRSAPADAWLMRCALCMVLGGALGNIIDRIRLGEVVDFFDFGLAGLRWPIFNIADSFVSVGIVLLIIAYSRQAPPAQAEAAVEADK